MKYDMDKVENFEYQDSTDTTITKAREIRDDPNAIKQIDSTNFVVAGINPYHYPYLYLYYRQRTVLLVHIYQGGHHQKN